MKVGSEILKTTSRQRVYTLKNKIRGHCVANKEERSAAHFHDARFNHKTILLSNMCTPQFLLQLAAHAHTTYELCAY